MQESLENRIRERAYALWVAAGRIEGQADQHWLAAEREVLNERAAPIAFTAKALAAGARLPRAKRTTGGVPRKKAS